MKPPGWPERRDDELWRKIRQRVADPKNLRMMSWGQLAKIARELGYEDYAKAWERSEVGAR